VRDRRAVAAHGCPTHTQRAAAQAACSRRDSFAPPGPLKAAPQPAAAARCRGSTAVGSKVSPPGVARSKPQTPRAGRWRDDEPAELKSGMPRCGDASRPVGSSEPRRPARPRTFFDGATRHKTRTLLRRENDGSCLKIELENCSDDRLARFPSPLAGESA
jgi:hypothetical protein